jgi:hypothetical protein
VIAFFVLIPMPNHGFVRFSPYPRHHFKTTILLDIPSWLETKRGTGEPLSVVHEQVDVKNWLTEGLHDEIAAAFPSASDIEVGTGSCNKTCFEDQCQKLFTPGRSFASNKQVEQAAFRLGYPCCPQWEEDYVP